MTNGPLTRKTGSSKLPASMDRTFQDQGATMKCARIVAATFMGILAATRAEAAALYSTTDLGASYTLETTTGGYAVNPYSPLYGVANSDGSVVYAFDKSPVTPINLRTDYQIHDAYMLLTLQNGPHQVGYLSDNYSQSGVLSSPAPNGFFDWSMPTGGTSPVSDINSHGQFVGTSIYGSATIAAFSDPNGFSHELTGKGSAITDNLNDYIATIPGVSLTSAFAIDDLGRILAFGSNGDTYLLTPTALGGPETVPEPTAAVIFCVVGSVLGFRSIRRRLGRSEESTATRISPCN